MGPVVGHISLKDLKVIKSSVYFKDEIRKFEDLLATDELFIEYFNSFLKLPSFPEPLYFNKETGGFEILTNAKNEMVSQVKAAIRSSQRSSKIYNPVKNHSFSNIPLIPIEDGKLTEECEIDTSFSVTILNKEQGIEWIKAERLPIFMESDCYVEYRLAKLLSQTKIPPPDIFYDVKIDYQPYQRVSQKQEVIEEEKEVDETQALMAEMFVSMGESSTTITDMWMSEAKMAVQMETTMWSPSPKMVSPLPCVSSPLHSSSRRPYSAAVSSGRLPDHTDLESSQVQTGRPISAMSYGQTESGYCSPTKSFVSSMDYGMNNSSVVSAADHTDEGITYTEDSETIESMLYGMEKKPIIALDSDTVCMVGDSSSTEGLSSSVVYVKPPRSISSGEAVESENKNHSKSESSSQKLQEDISKETENFPLSETVLFNDLDTLGDVMVGTALKRACAEVTGQRMQDIQDHTIFKSLPPSNQHADISSGSFENIAVMAETDMETKLAETVLETSAEKVTRVVTSKGQEMSSPESDCDSLLNSDDDYEESDVFFRKRKRMDYELSSLKGISEFYKFLKGGRGELYWNFWIDIEHGRFISRYAEEQSYLTKIRECYHQCGAVFELDMVMKKELGLIQSAQWTLENLFAAQNRIAEPLLHYWAPQFLVHQKKKAKPEKNYLYNQRLISTFNSDSFPHPVTMSLLPLRPKSCAPRLTHHQQMTVTQPNKNETLTSQSWHCDSLLTSPSTGMKRRYDLPNAFQKRCTGEGRDQVCSPKDNKESKKYIRRVPKDFIALYPSPESRGIDNHLSHNSFPRTQEDWPYNSADMPSPHLPEKQPPQKRRSFSARPLSTARSSSISQQKQRPRSAMQLLQQHSSMQQDAWECSSQLSAVSGQDQQAEIASTPPSDIDVSSEVSGFVGGERMEGLLQALKNENRAGKFMKKYIDRTANVLWMNCLRFWLELQEYHKLFYAALFDSFALRKKSRSLHSQYIVCGAPRDIDCEQAVRDNIYTKLDPPFEELFDEAEEHMLSILYKAWSYVLSTDLTTFEKVELIDVKRHLEAKSRYVLTLQRRGVIKEVLEPEEDPMQDYEDPVYDEALLEKIPKEFLEYTLEKLVHNRIELEHFRVFLADNYASIDLMCWMDIESFRRIPHNEERRRDSRAKDIKFKYLNKKYFFGSNSPAGKVGQEKVVTAAGGWGKLLEDRPPTIMILEAQKYVQDRLEKKWLPLFLATENFAERQKPQAVIEDYVDDVMLQRKKKSQAIWKILEGKWVSSSKDIITFRKALLNPVTSLHFRKYVSVKGDNLENDVLFWQEVQCYKELCHNHSDKSLIQAKTAAIINSFLDSQIPPSLQIDVPHEQAEKIMDRKLEAAPYLFRETQLTVFRVLFSHWNDFCEFRSNITGDKILHTLERHRRRAKKKDRETQRLLEEQNEREANRSTLDHTVNDEGEEEEVEQMFRDFEKAAGGSDVADGGSEMGEKEHMFWSYSQYISALDKESILNTVDESSFSTFMLGGNMEDDKESVHSKSPDNTTRKDDSNKKMRSSKNSKKTGTRPSSGMRRDKCSKLVCSE